MIKIKKITGASLIAFMVCFFVFAGLEPSMLWAIEDQFVVTQTVTAEISFQSSANDCALSPSIPGMTGGTSNCQTQVVVNTNNSTGYNMTIKASNSPAMMGNTMGGYINDFTSASSSGMEPQGAWEVHSSAEFGYTVSASTTSDLDPSFLDDGSGNCNSGANDTGGSASCWIGATTTPAFTIINRSTPTTSSGATSTLYFRVQIPSSPNPAVPEDTYTATATLTALTN